MCGRSALQYVRFRHEDTDIVRAARQQDFLRQAKQQITASKLFDNHTRLTRIFGRNTSTDAALRSRSEVLRLLKLALFSANQPIQEITLPRHARAELRGGDPASRWPDDRRVPQRQGHARAARRSPGARSSGPNASASYASSAGSRTPPASARTRRCRRYRPGRGRRCRRSTRRCACRDPSTRARRACTSCAAPTASATAPTGWSSRPGGRASTTASRASPGETRRSSRASPRRARSAGAPTSSPTTATGCAWWPGGRPRPSTGSPTRCSCH